MTIRAPYACTKMFSILPRNHLRAQGTLFIGLLLSGFVSAGQTNRTIDDFYGDFVTGVQVAYTGAWNTGQNCSSCALRPNANDTYAGTWHDTTSNFPNASIPDYLTLRFNGTAVWLYCIVVNSQPAVETPILTNISVHLDGHLAETYQHAPDPSQEQYKYNRTVFSMTNLSNTEHTLVMTAVQGSQPSVLLFDRAVYTFDDGEPSSSSSATSTSQTSTTSSSEPPSNSTHHGSPTGAIVGGVLGSVAFVALCLCFVIYWRRRQTVHYATDDMDHTAIDPFVPSRPLNYPGAAVFFREQHCASRFIQDSMPVDDMTVLTMAAISETPPSSGTSDARVFDEKRIEATSTLHGDNLTREAHDFRQQVTIVPAERSVLTPENGSTLLGSASTPASTVPAPASFQRSNSDNADLRREMASLRVEMAQLRAEGMQDVGPPPAY
ncbi:uncharacterized protein B0H18DRAFT_255259 [Fomitopsis serialis]|uniref:uncharacterized protein n=1 Tax=Fomitopsis serialis TaxID=139415 RepID=UPI002007E9D4|nr:uncharacterized protein B0H18DRAFT_255259 [Neoantrodia serialis]KAH9928346.1 hypothetical protein B0H18DRAFT_255259 [Neoantrodia serialis]